MSPDAKTRVTGCWISNGKMIQVAWRDGDVTHAPMSAARAPKVM